MVANETFACSKGLLFPTSAELEWTIPARACLHLIALLYSFVGMAIIAEVFMCAVERITSSTRKVAISKDKTKPIEYKDVLIWNSTVANVSLMALATSAPEIFISIIEVIGHNFKAGELGPGTIVGSAAFNLMVITAICIASVPNGEKRKISNISVYCVTAFWNVFAYLWLLFILIGSSKDEVEVWEGALTLIFFFVLVLTAYGTDKKLYRKCFKKSSNYFDDDGVVELYENDANSVLDDSVPVDMSNPIESTSHPVWHIIERATSLEFPNISDEDLAKVVALKINVQQPKHYLEHRINTIRKFSKTSVVTSIALEDLIMAEIQRAGHHQNESCVEFASRVYGIQSSDQEELIMKIVRRGSDEKRISVKFETANGVAKSNIHFVPKVEILTFDSGESVKFIKIALIKDATWTKGDVFMVSMSSDQSSSNDTVKIGECNMVEVIFIANEYEPISTSTEVEFVKPNVNLNQSKEYVRMSVIRRGYLQEKITIDWITEGIKSDEGTNPILSTGKVTFETGVIETYFDIPIVENMSIENNKFCLVRLKNPPTDVIIGQKCACVINNDSELSWFSKIDSMVPKMLESLRPWNQSWKEQFYRHIYLHGDHTNSPTLCDYILHIVAFPWKLVCAFVPPATYIGGWLTFIVAIILIGIVTTFCVDFANTFGCLIGLDNTVTAITFVAIGSSLPDTFASRIAAIQVFFG